MKVDPPAAGGGAGLRLRAVIVTLDHHLSGAFERAEARLAADGISIGFHAAADWESSPAALEACRADIARADIVIATMLFLDEHIRAVLPALEARRESCDAMLGLMSGSAIVRLTKLGGYRMDAPARGPLALLKRLRGSSRPADSGAGQMRMLRRLPKLLRFIPGTAQDVRAYFLTLQYWLAGSDDNAAEMVRALASRYAAGPREPLRARLRAAPPVEYPEVGVYHPRLAGRIGERAETLPRPAGGGRAGTVGLLLLRSYLLARDTAHYDGVIAALEARGLRVIPAFASGLDARPAVERYFEKDGRPTIDALVSLTGFSLVGGPAYNDARAAEELLARLDVPYVAAHPLEFQTLEQWGKGSQGLLPLEATMMVALPELDGGAVPSVYGGRSDGGGKPCDGCSRGCAFPAGGLVRAMQACPERAEALAGRVARLVALRCTPRAERRLAIVLFDFPPNSGAAGSAAHLSVFRSLWNLMAGLKAAGWRIDLPGSVEALKAAVLDGNAARHGADANVLRRVPADEIVRREPHLAEIEAQWGPAPGRVNADSGHVHVMGAEFGQLFVGLQPALGVEGDPMRLMFEGRYAPTHAMSAFYRHIREDFGAHVLLHFGTHGALEFLPGKQAGLSARCWPDRLIGDLPHVYLYAANNPSEGLLAKRRTGATLVSYLTPPLAMAGLSDQLAELRTLAGQWAASDGGSRDELAGLVAARAAAIDVVAEPLETLASRLDDIARERIPIGLHVVGEGLHGEALAAMLDAMPPEHRERAGQLLAADREIPALLHALDGGYVRPAPGGDVARNPEVLPTGRNLHGFDPFALPTAAAQAEGADLAERLIDRHRADTGQLPRALAMVLWGTDNLKSGGAQLAQALALVGARPRLDGYGRLCGAELIPLAELRRPRIDVILTLSGIFRDLLPLQTRMLAEACLLAATADEPEAMNFLRANTLDHAARLGIDLETAALRVFSNAEGAYGANVNLMIDSGCWSDPDELASAFERQKGFAYGVKGAPARQGAVMAAALATCELAYQNLESVELGVTTIDQYVDTLGGVSRLIRKGRGEAAPVYIGDATQGEAKVRRLEEQVALEVRTRMLNPAWYEPMLSHGGEGVHQIEAGVTAALGWSATTGEVSPWVWQRISETYVLDAAMRERMAALNPRACARVANRLLEASDRNFWQPDAATLEALRQAADSIEDILEGVSRQAA